MPKFSQISTQRLATCDLRLQEICNEAIKRVDFIVICGHRGQEEQEEAWLQKKTTKRWPHSKHNKFPSLAVDLAPYVPEVKIDWRDLPAFARLAGYLQRIAHEKGYEIRWGADWDGDWRTAGYDPNEKFVDGPHIEIVG